MRSWKSNYYGETKGRWAILTRSVCADFSQPHLWWYECFFLLVQEGTSSWECYLLLFWKKKESQIAPLASAVFQVPLTQSEQCAKAAVWGGVSWTSRYFVLPPLMCFLHSADNCDVNCRHLKELSLGECAQGEKLGGVFSHNSCFCIGPLSCVSSAALRRSNSQSHHLHVCHC